MFAAAIIVVPIATRVSAAQLLPVSVLLSCRL
jgi:hypothetical protein